jgi:A/G-specific adenine glycosylase
MASLPGSEWTAERQPPAGSVLATVTHVFTHLRLELSMVAVTAPPADCWWHPVDRLDSAGLPTLYRRAAEAVLAGRGCRQAA